MCKCNKINVFRLREHDRVKNFGGREGGGESQRTTGVKIVHFVFIFLFNGSMIMLGGLQVSSFSMLLYVYDIFIIKE